MRPDRRIRHPRAALALLACVYAGLSARSASAGEAVGLPGYFSQGWQEVSASPLKSTPAEAEKSARVTRSLAAPAGNPSRLLPAFFESSWAEVAQKPLKVASLAPSGARALKPTPPVLASVAPGLPAIITRGTVADSEASEGMPATAAAYAAPGDAEGAALAIPVPAPRPADIPGTQVAMLGGPGVGIEVGKLAVMTKLPAIANGACSVDDPYKVTALGENGRLALSPPATLDAAMVKSLGRWEAGVQAAAQKNLGEPIVGLRVAASYDCRTRNHVRGARLSEHGLANALDVSEFRTQSGQKITIERDFAVAGARGAFLKDVHAVTCDVFQTVLGPGSDGAHENHLHMDLGRSKICR